ncbi:hypothetical protein F5884DRAFT_767515 [Xylogone sp. PMI_703]|nr:hypothetical protein F5884DRAFT_767515 [Xylogone sp. PMI_703]
MDEPEYINTSIPEDEQRFQYSKEDLRNGGFAKTRLTNRRLYIAIRVGFIAISTAVLIPLIISIVKAVAGTGAKSRPLPISYTPKVYIDLTDSSPPSNSPCGSSPAEARTLGCRFDIMSFSWLPELCFDEELVEDFLARKKWIYYRQPLSDGVESQVPMDEVFAGDHEHLFVTWEFHKAHCAYMMRKLHRAVLASLPLDGYIGNYNHTKHCTEVAMEEGTDPNYIMTKIFTKYPSCEYLQKKQN